VHHGPLNVLLESSWSLIDRTPGSGLGTVASESLQFTSSR